jgi:outer membrane protein assembly factor BamB
MNFSLLVILAAFISAVAGEGALPMLNIDGFAWAENLVFDGLGGLFVSEASRGELIRISYDMQTKNYTTRVHVSNGLKQFGGLSVTPEGFTLYAAAVFSDSKNGIISVPTSAPKSGEQSYTVIIRDMDKPCNGLMHVASDKAVYCTTSAGTLTRVDIATGAKKDVLTGLASPDGLWYDKKTDNLFIGEMLTKKMRVFNVKSQALRPEEFAAISSYGSLHMMDDLTVVGDVNRNLGETKIVAADLTGQQIVEFALDGSWTQPMPVPEGITLFQPTSIRRGAGFGFDTNSYYITEGGGMGKTTNRRVLQLPPFSI